MSKKLTVKSHMWQRLLSLIKLSSKLINCFFVTTYKTWILFSGSSEMSKGSLAISISTSQLLNTPPHQSWTRQYSRRNKNCLDRSLVCQLFLITTDIQAPYPCCSQEDLLLQLQPNWLTHCFWDMPCGFRAHCEQSTDGVPAAH